MITISELVESRLVSLLGNNGNTTFITEKLHLHDDLALTSLNLIVLITGLCESLKIDLIGLSDVDIINIHTVGYLIE